MIGAGAGMVTPALTSTRQHLFLKLTRAVPRAASRAALSCGWLEAPCPTWARMRLEDMFHSAHVPFCTGRVGSACTVDLRYDFGSSLSLSGRNPA